MSKIQAGAKGRTVTRGVHYPHWKNGKHDWILEPNAHEPTVSEEDWAAVNAMVRDTGKERSASYNGVSPYLLSGLLRCSRCGFNFQGWSGKAKGHQYYRYVDGGWKNKGVCSHFALDRDALEAFVLSCVREVASDESFMDDIERSLERFVTGQSEQLKEERDQTLRKLERCEEDIRNITDAIAQGYRNESLKEKLTELERQKADHKRHISSLVPERRSVRKVLGLADRIRAFMADFEQKYEAASIPEKKLLLRLWVKDVLVEHDKKAVCVNVRNIPLIEGGADLEEALEHKKSAHNGESCERESSGDRT